MNTLTQLLSSMVALSVGVERVVEILKGSSRWLREDPDPRLDREGTISARRHMVLQMLASLSGGVIAYVIGPQNFVASLPEASHGSLLRITSSLLLGLMASGGSALWNHALDIVGAIKKVKEKAALDSVGPKQLRADIPIGP